MRNLVFGVFILTMAAVAGTTTAQSQTSVTIGPPSSGPIKSSNGNPAAPLTSATLNFAAYAGNGISVVGAAQTGTYKFEPTYGPVITAPEPSTMLLFSTGLLLVGVVLRRRLHVRKAK